LPALIFRKFRLAYRPGKGWLTPYFSANTTDLEDEKKSVVDIRTWHPRGHSLSIKDSKVGLFNAHVLKQRPSGAPVWICEGEWDVMALI